jgi:hypothetical protein
MSMRMSPDWEPAVTMSWRAPSSATMARPSMPLAPMTRIRWRSLVDMSWFLDLKAPPWRREGR